MIAAHHGHRACGGDLHLAAVLAVGFGLLGLTSAVTSYFRALLIQYVGSNSAFRMVAGLLHHMIRLPDTRFEARHTGDVMSRFDSTEPIRYFLTTGAFTLLVDAAMAVGALGVLLAYSWRLALAACVFVVLFAALRLGTYTPLRNLTHESIAAEARQSSSFIENVERHRAIKLLGAEAYRENVWGTRYVEAINAGIRLGRFGIHVNFVAAALGSIESVTMLLLGAANVIDGTFTVGMLMAFTAYANTFANRVHAVIDALIDVRMLRLHRERVADVGLTERETPAEGTGTPHDLEGQITGDVVRRHGHVALTAGATMGPGWGVRSIPASRQRAICHQTKGRCPIDNGVWLPNSSLWASVRQVTRLIPPNHLSPSPCRTARLRRLRPKWLRIVANSPMDRTAR